MQRNVTQMLQEQNVPHIELFNIARAEHSTN